MILQITNQPTVVYGKTQYCRFTKLRLIPIVNYVVNIIIVLHETYTDMNPGFGINEIACVLLTMFTYHSFSY